MRFAVVEIQREILLRRKTPDGVVCSDVEIHLVF